MTLTVGGTRVAYLLFKLLNFEWIQVDSYAVLATELLESNECALASAEVGMAPGRYFRGLGQRQAEAAHSSVQAVGRLRFGRSGSCRNGAHMPANDRVQGRHAAAKRAANTLKMAATLQRVSLRLKASARTDG
jgi:hypothetical protein